MLFLFISPIWFFALLAAFIIAESVMDAYEEGGSGSTSLLVFFLCILQFFSQYQPFTWIEHNFLTFFVGLLAYFAIGILWVRFKWNIKLIKEYKNRESRIERYKKNFGYNQEQISQEIKNKNYDKPIYASDYHGWFARTATYWPFSVGNFLLLDFVLTTFDVIFVWMSKTLQGDSDRIFQKTNNQVTTDKIDQDLS